MPADNLVALVMEQFGPSILDKLGSSLGVSRDEAQTAVGSAVPALLAGLAGLTSRPEGAAQLNAALQQQEGRGGDPSELLGGSTSPASVDEGRSLLDLLFGSSGMAGLTNALAKSTGISQGTIATLLGILGPVVMRVLRQHQKSERLDGPGLANLLNGQLGNIAGALPSGLSNMLRGSGVLGGLGDRLGQGARAADAAAQGVASRASAMAGNLPGATAGAAASISSPTLPRMQGGTGVRGLVLGAAVVLIAIAAIGYWMSGSPDVPTAVRQGAEQATGAAPSLVVGQVDLGKEVSGAVDTATSALRSVTDAASAQGAVPQLQDAAAQLDKLGGLTAQLPAAGKQLLAEMIGKLQPDLTAAIDQMATIPDAGDVLKPALDTLMAKLDALRAA
jgi:hypothetical protein